MKYFTSDLWSMLQDIDKQDEADKKWEENIIEYQKQFNLIKNRFSKKTLGILEKESMHDANLHSFEIVDRNTLNSVINKIYRPKRNIKNPMSVTIRMYTESYLYTLNYTKVRDIKTLFKSEGDLFSPYLGDFGDWGYSEFSSIDESLLCHEILFSSGAEIRIVFERLYICRKKIVV